MHPFFRITGEEKEALILDIIDHVVEHETSLVVVAYELLVASDGLQSSVGLEEFRDQCIVLIAKLMVVTKQGRQKVQSGESEKSQGGYSFNGSSSNQENNRILKKNSNSNRRSKNRKDDNDDENDDE